MRPKMLMTLQIAGFFIAVIGGLAAATQMLAADLGYHELLGEPLFVAGETPIYAPWEWLVWAEAYWETLPEPFEDSMLAFAVGAIIGLAWAVGLKRKFGPEDQSTAHGSSRWARRDEIEELDLAQSSKKSRGIILGRDPYSPRLLTHRGKEHAFVFAPTRSGKGVGIVVPTLLTWRGSVFVLDIKGENWDLTAGWRRKFSHVIRFDPTSRQSATYNPLLEIRQGEKEVRDTRNVVDILANPDGETRDDFWNQSAKKFLVGAILHVLYAGDDKSLAGVLHFLQNPEWTHEERLTRMLETKHLGDQAHPVVARAARATLNAPEDTRGGILATAESYLGLFDDPVVADVTSGPSDFRLTDMQYAPNPVSFYLVVPPGDMLRVRPLLRLLFVQMGARLTETLDPDADKHRLLMMLDEFPTLGKLEWFEAALAYVAGYDIKCYLVAQDLNQIQKAYGRDNAILGNCHLRIAYAPNDEKTAKRLSELLGKTTATKKQESLSGDRASFSLDRKSESEQEYARDLLTPGEIMQLDDTKELLFVAGSYPILAEKVRYYEDPHFQRRCPGIDPQASGEWAFHLQPPEIPSHGPYPDRPRPTAASDPWTSRAPIPPTPEDDSNSSSSDSESDPSPKTTSPSVPAQTPAATTDSTPSPSAPPVVDENPDDSGGTEAPSLPQLPDPEDSDDEDDATHDATDENDAGAQPPKSTDLSPF